jgi:ketosteroid isomerase-like protein
MSGTDTNTVHSPDEARIRDLLSEREQALRQRDADRLIAQYAPEVAVFSLAPPLRQPDSWTHDPAGLRDWFATFDGPIGYEFTELHVTVGGDVAYCHSINRLAAMPHGVPQGFELWFRCTICLRRTGDGWRIAHAHESTPFYMDGSMRAAIDLRP